MNALGEKLKAWRQSRHLSQLQLAVDAEVSPRHLSFIETGRSKPSREMVLRLAEQLRVPLREKNAFLLAAGFAPAFAHRELDTPELSAVKAAAAHVLEQHLPFPAIALDRQRNVVMANCAARKLAKRISPQIAQNIYRLLLHPDGLAPQIVGFAAYSRHLVTRLSRDAQTSGSPELHALLAEVEQYPNVASGDETIEPIALTLRLKHDSAELAFFTTLSTFGTPFDVTVSELVIEALFPADQATARQLSEVDPKIRAKT